MRQKKELPKAPNPGHKPGMVFGWHGGVWDMLRQKKTRLCASSPFLMPVIASQLEKIPPQRILFILKIQRARWFHPSTFKCLGNCLRASKYEVVLNYFCMLLEYLIAAWRTKQVFTSCTCVIFSFKCQKQHSSKGLTVARMLFLAIHPPSYLRTYTTRE